MKVFSRTLHFKTRVYCNERISTTDRSEYLIYALTTQVTVVVHYAHVLKGLKLDLFIMDVP